MGKENGGRVPPAPACARGLLFLDDIDVKESENKCEYDKKTHIQNSLYSGYGRFERGGNGPDDAELQRPHCAVLY